MPYFSLQTNLMPEAEIQDDFLKEVSKLLSEILGKSEDYVMVGLVPGVCYRFGGTVDPMAFGQLKSIGLAETQTQEISATLSKFIEDKLGVPQTRIFIEMVDVPRAYFAWNGNTFA